MTAAPHALVVDDEAQMVSIVAFALETQGFTVSTARSAEAAWDALRRVRVDLVVLDVMLPGASGVTLTRRIRAASDVPVILLTARGEEEDRLAGLAAGADDYVTKPFSPRELALRAEAILRRTRPARDADLLVNGPLRIDLRRREVSVDGRAVHLSDVELRLLVALARNAGSAVTWLDLLNEVWGTTESRGGREMIKTSVHRLRQRLDADLVRAVRGVGYVMPQLDPGSDER